ncbi:glycoside hydrolase/phage tail family protein [Methylocystis sp. WRRC1]|uniref:baseplate multidomain protein megatron n=1 Tax=Methylocystis sp. WRRC1 TaxID=1732014 RepID=UPI001D157376|nr:glycoside hydrolase/phage tail family protein [Methylocystis sp. WRRC1]MCC3244692.1 glycoside hydrolase/phage tail family protein [Methylocystis sp. WRRC1]
MATLVLQTVGSVVGGAVAGPIGSTIGRLVGAAGGAFIDQALQPQSSPRYSIGPRLKSMDGVTSMEGAGVPRVYGRARIGGQMIWATRFLERVSVAPGNSQKSGKGTGGGDAPTFNFTYSYSANFAIALCEGPIAFVRRIWADGSELDMTTLPIRIYTGTENQGPDPLIVAKEGGGNAPAYRGLAYIVFDDLPLAAFGNRIPQFTFEVVKPVAGLGEMIRGVDLIPGATEAGYLPTLKLNFYSPGATAAENRHQLTAATDWTASIDALQALCPNLESVALVVAWFGDDLRAEHCTVTPRVDAPFKTIGQFNYIIGPYWPPDWSVAGQTRATAQIVSQIDGRAAYGGTPSDASVVAAISDLKARGLSVVFYPFLMMDVPPGNTLANPYTGGDGQPVFPWRGRITCDPAPGRPASPDATAAAASQINAFVARYRTFILHYANLCQSAGGVDAFLIGSEMIGLTRVRSAPGQYPFVTALTALAADVKEIVGGATKVSYSADWTEYGAHVPTAGELRFPLDPFWASSAVDFIGVDVYWPLSDWRDGDAHLDAQEAASVHDLAYLTSRVASGEGYDWYYADASARAAQVRTPITDGLGKPWVHRQKDFLSFWSQQHYERVGDAELAAPTAWVPQSKPIWIMETGCPAVDRGANAPNVFPDARSSEGGLPYFSRDGRDDLMQARFLEAMIAHFDPTRPGGATANPTSAVYGGPMVDPSRIHVWCWDARPFPAFPSQSAVWSDAANWETGHWLNGRLEGVPLDRLAVELAKAVEAPGLVVDRPNIGGFLDGYVVERPMSPREAIDPLCALYGFDAVVGGGKLDFIERRGAATSIDDDDLVAGRDATLVTLTRAQESELPHEIALSYSDSENDFQMARVLSRRLEGLSARQSEAQAAVMTHRANAQMLANVWLQDLWIGRETAEFALRPGLVALRPGDLVRLGAAGGGRLFQIQRITDGAARQVSARAIDPSVYDVPAPRISRNATASPKILGPPRVVVLDLAIERDQPALSYVAAFADPWPGSLAIVKLTGGDAETVGVIGKRGTIGDTLDTLRAGPVARFDNGSSVTVRLSGGELASVDDLAALAGKSAMAIQGGDGAWEIFSFAHAELVAARTFRLSRLIRGLGGEEHLAACDAPAGSTVVLLDDALVPLARKVSEIGAPITYAIGPADRNYADPLYVRASVTATNKSLRPYAPTQARALRTVNGIVISFIRRSRVDSDAWETLDVPLGEASEAYEAEIALPAGTRRLVATTPSILYPAAQEIADFGAEQSVISLSIYQISATVGRGFPLTVTLDVQ